MPVANGTVDVITSNCVINLSPDKDAVFSEAYRVLKPGGRFAVSDIVTRGEVPERFRRALELWAGCLSGALDEDDYISRVRAAGFRDVRVVSRAIYDAAQTDDWEREQAQTTGEDPAVILGQIAGKIASAQIWAIK